MRNTHPATEMSEQEPKVELIPWDCESVEHVERMYQQRVSCGWRSDEVRERWVELTRAGNKALYWVVSFFCAHAPGGILWATYLTPRTYPKVLRDDLPGRDELLSRHLAEYPEAS